MQAVADQLVEQMAAVAPLPEDDRADDDEDGGASDPEPDSQSNPSPEPSPPRDADFAHDPASPNAYPAPELPLSQDDGMAYLLHTSEHDSQDCVMYEHKHDDLLGGSRYVYFAYGP